MSYHTVSLLLYGYFDLSIRESFLQIVVVSSRSSPYGTGGGLCIVTTVRIGDTTVIGGFTSRRANVICAPKDRPAVSSIEFDFENEVAIVTGGSSGIGREIVLAFAEAGATVLSADIRETPRGSHNDTPTHEAASDLSGEVQYVRTDVSEPKDVRGVIEKAREFGGVDVMVNNAGVHIPQSILDVTIEDFDKVMDINARGVLLGCQYAAADMLDRGDPGVIINTASINSNHAMREQAAYCASKGAVRMITYAAALDLADTGIRVNAVAPGVIETEVARPIEEVRESASEGEFIKEIPLGRSGKPEEIADGALYLASDAASYVTGELLHIDGGWQAF